MNERVVSGCDGCLKKEPGGRICSVFKDPAYQHRNGKCFGYINDPKDMAKLYLDLALNADSQIMARSHLREAKAWREKAGQLPPGDEPVMKRRGRLK
jgi:hypothetical protein